MSDPKQSLIQLLQEYAGSDTYPFHMPGHKRQPFLLPSSSTAELFDITEITGFDDLHHPDGILKEAQERMADVFGAHQSFFLVNGSTAGILAAICACTKKGSRILMARNCHKSVYHAAFLQELTIDYIEPPVSDCGIAGSISPKAVQEKLERQRSSFDTSRISAASRTGTATGQDRSKPPYDAVIITSPTYDGIVSDIESIAGIAHAYGIPLIVDAAHGAHFGFSGAFPKKALALGADIAIESLHKTLPAFTQSASLHLADSPLIDEEKVRRYLSVFQTSSPSYLLMAGLDRCVQILQSDAPRMFADYEKKLTVFYEKAVSLKHISVLFAGEHLADLKKVHAAKQKSSTSLQQNPNVSGRKNQNSSHRFPVFSKDPSKILISGEGIGLNGAALFSVLRDRCHLELEMSSLHYVTALTSVMDTAAGLDRLICALQELDQCGLAEGTFRSTDEAKAHPEAFLSVLASESAGKCPDTPGTPGPISQSGSAASLPIHEALSRPAGQIRLGDCAGRICADFIIPYPPGIPLLVPGEQITKSHISKIEACFVQHCTVYGLHF